MNKMKRVLVLIQLVFIIIIISSNYLIGQNKHEIKIDALSFRAKDLQFSYECLLNGRSGIEVDFRFLNESRYIDPNFGLPTSNNNIEVFHKGFMTQLSYNKYFFAKGKSKGLVIGGFGRYIFYTKVDDKYISLYENYFNKKFDKSMWARLDIGATVGWKFILSEHIVIEPSYSTGINLIELFEEKIISTLSGIHLNFGYRF